MSLWSAAARPVLFRVNPELAQWIAICALRPYGLISRKTPELAPQQLMGLRFPNRFGLAAGLDKDAAAVRGFANLGFGFIEVGTVTPERQPGNAKPRLFRLPSDQALVNRMGFNSVGSSKVRERLVRLRGGASLAFPIGVNIGKNASTPIDAALNDYILGVKAMHPLADYLTVNISSPNTPRLRELQGSDRVEELCSTLVEVGQQLDREAGRQVPLLVKLSPDLHETALAELGRAIKGSGISGVIATNTTTTRPNLKDQERRSEVGGLSGRPLAPLAVAAVQVLRKALGPTFPIIGVGGINDAESAQRMFDAGADLVQLCTGLIFEGPGLVRRLQRASTRDDAACRPRFTASNFPPEPASTAQ